MNTLRAAGLIALPVGALGSVGFLLRAGRTAPPVLIALFVLWVLAPFVLLVAANARSNRWSAPTRTTLTIVMLVIALGSLAVYGTVTLGSSARRTVPFFVMTPPVSSALIALALAIAAFASRRR